MKNYNLFIILILLFSTSSTFSQKDTRSFEQINDSIIKEAQLIYDYDRAFVNTMRAMEEDKKLRKEGGEILTYSKGDSLVTVILNAEKSDKVLAEFRFAFADDPPVSAIKTRDLSEFEANLFEKKHLVMNEVQAKYNLTYPENDEFFNPVFISTTTKKHGVEIPIFKFYLLTETNATGVIPFGRDYLFYADQEGKVFYNLQFNGYMPVPITMEISDIGVVELEYPEREPYITPSDIYLFRKYAGRYELQMLRVKSAYLGVFFNYDLERDTIDLTME